MLVSRLFVAALVAATATPAVAAVAPAPGVPQGCDGEAGARLSFAVPTQAEQACFPQTIDGRFSGENAVPFSWSGTLTMSRHNPFPGAPWNGDYQGTASIQWTRTAPPPPGCVFVSPTSGTAAAAVNMSIKLNPYQEGWSYTGSTASVSLPSVVNCSGGVQSSLGGTIESAFYAWVPSSIAVTLDQQIFAGTAVNGPQKWTWDLKGDAANPPKKLSEIGLRFIMREEAFRPKAYEDDVGYCTIGYGHLLLPKRACTAADRKLKWTKPKAEAELKKALDTKFEPLVRAVGAKLTQCQYDALVSFAYNVSGRSWGQIKTSLTPAALASAAGRIRQFNKAFDQKTGKPRVLDILTRRRNREAALFERKPCPCDGILPAMSPPYFPPLPKLPVTSPSPPGPSIN